MHNDQPVLLLLDTATTACSVALSVGHEIVAHKTAPDAQRRLAELIAPMVEEVLGEMHRLGYRLDAIALSQGPGSYTGLRVGSSLAKGLCHGFGVPLIAVSTLELLVEAFRQQTSELHGLGYIHPMIDARRMEVYTATFTLDGTRLSEDAPLVLEDAGLYDRHQEVEHYFVGDGASKVRTLLPDLESTHVVELKPDASYMLPMALDAWQSRAFVDLAYWKPAYLKEYTATISRNKVLG